MQKNDVLRGVSKKNIKSLLSLFHCNTIYLIIRIALWPKHIGRHAKKTKMPCLRALMLQNFARRMYRS